METTSRFIIIAMLLLFTSHAHGQFVRPFPQGLGIEVGGGHNDATWHPQTYPGQELTRGQLSFTPTARLSYALYPFNDATVTPFVEYNRFGGRSREFSNGYKDGYWFDALGVGMIGTYTLSSFSFGPGIKLNRHLKVTGESVGAANVPSNEGEDWYVQDVSRFFRKTSLDLGVRIAWNVSQWSVAGETWVGVTQLQSWELDPYMDVYQRHFRILVGYRL